MVQRKVNNKLGIQADQVKNNKLLLNLLKPSSLQHQDVKSKGTDLKKKMKKSRSTTKRSDIERLGSRSPNIRRQIPQPGKPPPPQTPVFPKPVASPQKKSPVKTAEATPNYMKSTSSFDARTERSQPQVSSRRNLQSLFDSKSSSSKNPNSAKLSAGSVHKTARILARTSSLKLVRTLTKTISFKPGRASAKKCSPLVLSENLHVQRGTCSSTMKDSKFPAYLELSSGATESEGTSVMKVCPYTYCSLNGHHHAPLPPLKSFLSARRRMLKAQRGMKLGCTSPRRSNPISNCMEENQVEQVNFDKPSPNQEILNGSMTIPFTEEEHRDFFVQIYSKERESTAEITECFDHIKPIVDDGHGYDETATELDDRQVLEILSGESPFSAMDFHDDNNDNSDSISMNTEAAEYYEEMNQNIEDEGGHSIFPTQRKSGLESLSWSHDDVESRAIIPIDNTEFGLSDMDWQAESYFVMYLDYGADCSFQSTPNTDLQGESNEFGSYIIPTKSIFMSDDIVNRCFKEIQAAGLQQESLDEEAFDDESVSSKGGSYQDFEIEEFIEGPDDKSNDQLEELATIVEEDGTVKLEGCGRTITETTSISLEKPIQEPCSAGKDSEITKICLQDDEAAEEIWDLDSQDFHDMNEQSSKAECKGPLGSKDEVVPYQFDADSSLSSLELEMVNGSISPKGKTSELQRNCYNHEHLVNEAEVEDEEKENIDPGKELIGVASEAVKNTSREELNENHLEPLDIDRKSDETLEENEAENIEPSDFLSEKTSPTSMHTSSASRVIDNLGSHTCQEFDETCDKLKWRTGSKRFIEEYKEPKDFNPRGPNFLPVEPDPEAERVDLKHQMMDERKNTDEWMLDYAIQQAVTKLGPARKKKVALLVEAFETVMPVPRYETQLRHASVAFTHAQQIQACS